LNDTVAVVPVPLRLTVCVLPVVSLLLSVNVKVPIAAPVVVGAKVTATVQAPFDPATGLEVEHVVPVVAMAKGLVAVIPVKVRLALPVLVTVTVCEALVVLTA